MLKGRLEVYGSMMLSCNLAVSFGAVIDWRHLVSSANVHMYIAREQLSKHVSLATGIGFPFVLPCLSLNFDWIDDNER